MDEIRQRPTTPTVAPDGEVSSSWSTLEKSGYVPSEDVVQLGLTSSENGAHRDWDEVSEKILKENQDLWESLAEK